MENIPTTFTSIICLNETESKFYVYTQDGLLINRVDFAALTHKYGKPIAGSNNGLNFIFKHVDQRKNLRDDYKDREKLYKRMFTVSVMTMSIFGINHVKDINLLEEIQSNQEEFRNSWISEVEREDLIEYIDFKIDINDRFDVCVRIALKEPPEKEFKVVRDMYHVFEPAHINIKLDQKSKFNYWVRENLVKLNANSGNY